MLSRFCAASTLIQRGVFLTAHASFHTLSTRASVNRGKSKGRGTHVAKWQLALIIIASVVGFLLLTLLSVGIIRWHRAKRTEPVIIEESLEMQGPGPDGVKASGEGESVQKNKPGAEDTSGKSKEPDIRDHNRALDRPPARAYNQPRGYVGRKG
ncbi:uncharacterized protein K460DRAFT_18193 [Cucurbitaria berberidis CBS 394.84]|uniref:Uncharacterized protein n=1 Tax=Cucurbitaria berberidis CBS 394.84 TaxID=1168544 RepID=A0A9P4LD19_9PLEO|nr:uncharacterized protein K460DRAFT_18193 [Cucurbitaria berberidis CBS 394.84]KAF1850595.1 hypothetical protein K460DRAFT_18193 [Cucurbitaria berberidis CBS 394.84]